MSKEARHEVIRLLSRICYPEARIDDLSKLANFIAPDKPEAEVTDLEALRQRTYRAEMETELLRHRAVAAEQRIAALRKDYEAVSQERMELLTEREAHWRQRWCSQCNVEVKCAACWGPGGVICAPCSEKETR
jgi:chromosome segregation ATPase